MGDADEALAGVPVGQGGALSVCGAAWRGRRHDGWTPDRRRAFLEHVADGLSVRAACARVGLSVSSAYALRRSAAGADFALGWAAASLLARHAIADTLVERALEGYEEHVTRPDGTAIIRFRHDNRLAASMLARLDRLADAPACGPDAAAARVVASDFDAFLAAMEAGHGPARAGLFLARRLAPEAVDLAPVAALARADRFARVGAALADEVDTADLDPAARAGWTVDQWCRADAAGLLAPPLAAALAPAPGGEDVPLVAGDADDEETEEEAERRHADEERWDRRDAAGHAPWDDAGHVWLDCCANDWRTDFPPPPGFAGMESGLPGGADYERALAPDERAILDARVDASIRAERAAAASLRDAFFGFTPAPAPPEPP